MSKPLMPTIDAAGRLREAASALLVRDRGPVGIGALAGARGRVLNGAAANSSTWQRLAGAAPPTGPAALLRSALWPDARRGTAVVQRLSQPR